MACVCGTAVEPAARRHWLCDHRHRIDSASVDCATRDLPRDIRTDLRGPAADTSHLDGPRAAGRDLARRAWLLARAALVLCGDRRAFHGLLHRGDGQPWRA